MFRITQAKLLFDRVHSTPTRPIPLVLIRPLRHLDINITLSVTSCATRCHLRAWPVLLPSLHLSQASILR